MIDAASSVRAAIVEAALRKHRDVQHVQVRDTTSQDPVQAKVDGLTAVVVPVESSTASLPADTLVESWRTFFDSSYETALDDGDERRAALTGWVDSFTGRPFPASHIAEWAGATVQRIRALAPNRVLEIGSGTGLIMRPLVESASLAAYTATDFSPQATAMLDRFATREEGTSTAIEVVTGESLDAVHLDYDRDTTVINSVVQYFPSFAYLDRLLAAAVERTPPGGHVFLGDLRNADLLTEFAALKHHLLAGPGNPDEEVSLHIQRQLRSDSELSVSPQFLNGLPARFPRVSAVEIAPRRGFLANEMTLFRYDAVLHIECEVNEPLISWDPHEPDLDVIDRRLASSATCSNTAFGYLSVPNARLAQATQLLRRYGIRDQAAPLQARAIDPEVLWQAVERRGATARVSWRRPLPDGAFDVSFIRQGSRHFTIADPEMKVGGGRVAPPPAMFAPLVAERRAAALRAMLAEEVPEHGPVNVVFVPWLPAETIPLPFGVAI